jgi:hypothetical protein
MRRRPLLASLAALVALPLVLYGCKIDTINYFPPHPATVKVSNFLIGAPAIDWSVNGTVDWPALPFEATGATRSYTNDRTTFSYRVTGTTTDLMSVTLDLAGNAPYTFLAYGSTGTLPAGLLALVDTPVTPPSGQFQTRFVNIASLLTNIDIYVTAPDVALENTTPRYVGVGYTTVTAYQTDPSGSNRIRITPTGYTAPVIYDSGTVQFPSGSTADVVLYDVGSGTLLNAAILGTGSNPQITMLPNQFARLRVANFAPQAGAIDSRVDGISFTTGTAYGDLTVYNVLKPGDRRVSIESQSTPGVPLAATTATIAAGTHSTVMLTGYAGSNAITVLPDTNIYNPAVSMRFVNASPDAGPVQILANDTVVVSSLGTNAASSYVTLAGGTYTFVVKNAASGTTLATFSGNELTAGQTYSAFVYGPATGLGLKRALDR